ncbi:unnamed protein product [Urochloa humidicola]
MGGGTERRSTRDAGCQTDRDPGSATKRIELSGSAEADRDPGSAKKRIKLSESAEADRDPGSATKMLKLSESAEESSRKRLKRLEWGRREVRSAVAKDYPARSSGGLPEVLPSRSEAMVPSRSHSPRVYAQPHPMGVRPAVPSRPLETMSYPPVQPMGLWQLMPPQPVPGYMDLSRHPWQMPPTHMMPTSWTLSARRFESQSAISVACRQGTLPEPVTMESRSRSKPTWLWEAGGRLVERLSSSPLVKDQSAVPVGRLVKELPSQAIGCNTEEEERWIDSSTALHVPLPSTSNRPLPFSCPPFPKGGSQKEITEWNKARWRIYKLGANDLITYPGILRETKDTDSAVTSSREKEAVHRVAQSIVSISSIGHDGGTDRTVCWNRHWFV